MDNGGKCQPSYVLADVYYACTAVNILTDWVTAFLYGSPFHILQVCNRRADSNRPVPLLWNVQINRNTKISIVGLMGLGILYVDLHPSPLRFLS